MAKLDPTKMKDWEIAEAAEANMKTVYQLAEEMQLTTTALLNGNVERAEDAYDVLMRAMLQLPDYLEGIQAGKKDAPITLMPLINDLRAARKEGLLTESVLFSPDIENAVIPSHGYDAAAIEAGKLQAEVKRLRKENQRLQMEREILKKAAAFFAKESK